MSVSGLLGRASKSKLVKIGDSSLGRGVGDEIYAWRFSFRNEGVVGWERGSCGLKVGVEGGRSSVGGLFWFILLFFSPLGVSVLRGWGAMVGALFSSISAVSWSGQVVSLRCCDFILFLYLCILFFLALLFLLFSAVIAVFVPCWAGGGVSPLGGLGIFWGGEGGVRVDSVVSVRYVLGICLICHGICCLF